MTLQKIYFVFAVLLCALCACANTERFRRPATPEEQAAGDALAKKMVDSLGGADAFDAIQTLSWEFAPHVLGKKVVVRKHDWDKARNWSHVVSGNGSEKTETWLDLRTKKGCAKTGDAVVAEPEAKEKQLENAFAAWTNDSYWLISPFKVFDRGVIRARIDGGLRTTFQGVGLTPGDAYIYTFDSEGALKGWDFLLQSGFSASFVFTESVILEGVTFFGVKKGAAKSEIRLQNIRASSQTRDEIWRPLADPASCVGG